MEEKLVSIIVPVYNHEKFVVDCINSIINQVYENIELIIINDGSKDSSSEKVKSMSEACEKRFKRFIFIDKPNEGLCKTINRGVRESKGEYITLIASDDMMLEDKIQTQVEFLLNNDINAVLSNAYILNNNNGHMDLFYEQIPKWTSMSRYELFEQLLLHGNCLNPTGMYKKEVFTNIGLFDENLNFEDWDFYLRLSYNYNIGYIDKPLFIYRRHGDNTSGVKNLLFMLEGNKQTLDKAFELFEIKNKEKIREKTYTSLYLSFANYYKGINNSLYEEYIKKARKLSPFNLTIYFHTIKHYIKMKVGKDNWQKLKRIIKKEKISD